MLSNENAIERLHSIYNHITNGNTPTLTIDDAWACEIGASAICTIDDMSDVFQKLITLTPSDIDFENKIIDINLDLSDLTSINNKTDEDLKTIHPIFEVGGLNENGAFEETDKNQK